MATAIPLNSRLQHSEYAVMAHALMYKISDYLYEYFSRFASSFSFGAHERGEFDLRCNRRPTPDLRDDA